MHSIILCQGLMQSTICRGQGLMESIICQGLMESFICRVQGLMQSIICRGLMQSLNPNHTSGTGINEIHHMTGIDAIPESQSYVRDLCSPSYDGY